MIVLQMLWASTSWCRRVHGDQLLRCFAKTTIVWLPPATHWAHSFRYHRDAELAAGALANLLFWVERREVRLPPPPRPKISC